jgi:hypothetical protein
MFSYLRDPLQLRGFEWLRGRLDRGNPGGEVQNSPGTPSLLPQVQCARVAFPVAGESGQFQWAEVASTATAIKAANAMLAISAKVPSIGWPWKYSS